MHEMAIHDPRPIARPTGHHASQKPGAGVVVFQRSKKAGKVLPRIVNLWGNGVHMLACMFGLGSVLASCEAVCMS